MVVVFEGMIEVGGVAFTSEGRDTVVVKLDPAGSLLWSKQFDDAVGFQPLTDSAGNVVLVGSFEHQVVIEGQTYATAGLPDVMVVKLDPSGTFLWAHQFGDSSSQEAFQAATDLDGSVVVTGAVQETDVQDGNKDDDDIFVFKLDSAGHEIWSKRFGGSGWDVGVSVATDLERNVILTGYLGESFVDFGAETLAGNTYDVFVAKLAP